jgi:two-component system invasion response regulator UvrY
MTDQIKRIILVDDHVLVRNGLKVLIEKLGPYKIVSEFDDGESFLKSRLLKGETDLIILDLSLPGMNGDIVMEKLNAKKVRIPVLVLTLNRDESMIIKLFRNGVRGYLGKDCSAAEMQKALEQIFSTGYYHNDFLTMSLLQNPVVPLQNTQQRILAGLTSREKEFLYYVCDEKEMTYEQIATKMNVQHRTVDGYRENIFAKFGIKSKTGLVLFVLKHKLYDHLQVNADRESM